MKNLQEHWFSYALILIWLVVYAICKRGDLVASFANQGFAIIGREYYRFATALFLHSNLIHVIVNAVTIYWIGQYLEPQINPVWLFVFSITIGVVTEVAFSVIFRNATGIGGSPMVFALIGLIVALQIRKVSPIPFQLGTWYGNWIAGYTILSNIPLFSDNFVSTLFIHVFPMVLGCLLGSFWKFA